MLADAIGAPACRVAAAGAAFRAGLSKSFNQRSWAPVGSAFTGLGADALPAVISCLSAAGMAPPSPNPAERPDSCWRSVSVRLKAFHRKASIGSISCERISSSSSIPRNSRATAVGSMSRTRSGLTNRFRSDGMDFGAIPPETWAPKDPTRGRSPGAPAFTASNRCSRCHN